MPRTRTDAYERATQRQTAQERATAIVGHAVTHREAAAILRGDNAAGMLDNPRRRGPTHWQRPAQLHPLDLTPILLDQLDAGPDVRSLRLSLARLRDLHITPEGIATTTLGVDARGFGDVLHDAIRASPSHLLAVTAYVLPRARLYDEPDARADVTDAARFGVRLQPPRVTDAAPNELAVPLQNRHGRIDLYDDTDRLASVGRFLAHVRELRTLPRGEWGLRLVTNGRAFGDVLRSAVLASVPAQLVCDMRLMPTPARPRQLAGDQ
jgi:hypothetical protein